MPQICNYSRVGAELWRGVEGYMDVAIHPFGCMTQSEITSLSAWLLLEPLFWPSSRTQGGEHYCCLPMAILLPAVAGEKGRRVVAVFTPWVLDLHYQAGELKVHCLCTAEPKKGMTAPPCTVPPSPPPAPSSPLSIFKVFYNWQFANFFKSNTQLLTVYCHSLSHQHSLSYI